MRTYKIIRYHADTTIPNKCILQGLTLEEAQEHCSKEYTHELGVWFDGYTEE